LEGGLAQRSCLLGVQLKDLLQWLVCLGENGDFRGRGEAHYKENEVKKRGVLTVIKHVASGYDIFLFISHDQHSR
jgi:hypothetical protein